MSLELVKYIHNELSEAQKEKFETKLKNDRQLQKQFDEFKTEVNLNDELFYKKIEDLKNGKVEERQDEKIEPVKVSFWNNPSLKMVATLTLVFLGIGIFSVNRVEQISKKGILTKSIQDSRISYSIDSTSLEVSPKIRIDVINNAEISNVVLVIQNKNKSIIINKNELLVKQDWSDIFELTGPELENSEKIFVGFTSNSSITKAEVLECFKSQDGCGITFKEYTTNEIK